MNRSVLYACVGVLLSPDSLLATKVRTWHSVGPNAFAEAKWSNVVVSNQGEARLGMPPTKLPTTPPLDFGRLWAARDLGDGSLLVAAGQDGKLLHIAATGEVTTILELKDGQFFCLTPGDGTDTFAAGGPDAVIHRIPKDGPPVSYCKLPEPYVWSLAYDAVGKHLYAATGPNGRIYRIDSTGKATVHLQTKQEHILCLAIGKDGVLYAGTDKQGLVYRISEPGKGFVLFQAPQSEIRALLLTETALYAGTAAPTKRRGASGTVNRTEVKPAVGTLTGSIKETTPTATVPIRLASETSATKDTPRDVERRPAPAPSLPTTGENSVFRLGFDGSVREIFREKAMMLSLAKFDAQLLVGTGLDGRLFAVNETDRTFSEIARLENGQIHSLLPLAAGGLLATTGDPGELFVLAPQRCRSGTLTSEVFDAKLVSKWGTIDWRADTPQGTKVTLAVRGGNVAVPDETWTEWTAELVAPGERSVPLPACRFLQYRATLSTEDSAVSPTLRSVTIRYATLNQAPELTALDVPDVDTGKEVGKLKVKWSATDANEDDLSYRLQIRRSDRHDWITLEEDFDKTEYELDPTTLSAGEYELKVIACDRPDNSEESALIAERISKPFLIVKEAPKATLKVIGRGESTITLEATAIDGVARLTSAAYCINGKQWQNLFPTDGLFDGRSKTFRFSIPRQVSGSQLVTVRVKNSAGFIGSVELVLANR